VRISSRRGTIAFFLCLGIGLVALAVALNVGWIILNWREGVLLFFGIVFFALIIAGMVVNTIFLVRELRRSERRSGCTWKPCSGATFRKNRSRSSTP
jgi:two-component system sensor histidine kinase SenX3